MALPNGPGALLSSAQAGIVDQAGVKLFGSGKVDPVQAAAKQELEERKVKAKTRPTPSDLLKLSGASSLGFLLLNDTINNLGAKLGVAGAGAGAGKMEDGFLKNVFGEDSLVSNIFSLAGGGKGGMAKGLAKKLGPKVGNLLGGSVGKLVVGGGLIAAGVLLAVKDGVAGSKQAKKWGVGKLNAGIAAGLTSSSKGASGALAGAAKYGLIGMGIGSIIPGVGTVLGGAIGVGVGTVLGAIGGERTAKFFQGVGKKVSGVWDKHGKKIMTGLTAGIGYLAGGPLGSFFAVNMRNLVKSGKMQAIWKSDSNIGKKMLMSVGAIASTTWDTVTGGLSAGVGLLSKGLTAITTKSDGTKNLLGKAADFVAGLPGKLLAGLDSLGEHIAGEEAWADLKNYFNDVILGGFKSFFQGIGGWIQKLFGLNDSAQEELERGKWEKSFKSSAEYKQREADEKSWKAAGKQGPAPESRDAFLERMWNERTRVDDGIFNLNKTLSAGSLFGQDKNIQFNDRDELYLMASTNPSRDALATAVASLNGLIGELASAIKDYRPQTHNIQTAVENTAIPLRELLSRPGAYSI